MARGAEARTCLGRRPLQRAAGGRLRWAAGRRWPSRAATSLGLEPALPSTQHVQGSLPTSRLGWPCSSLTGSKNRLGAWGSCSASCTLAASGPLPGDRSPQAPAWGRAGRGRRLVGAPQSGEGTLAAASPTRSEVRHYMLSYTKLFLGVLVSTNYTRLQVKIFILSQCFPGCVGPFLCSLC